MLPLTGKSKILLTLASKYINIFYLSLISIKKLLSLSGKYQRICLFSLVGTKKKC